MKKTVSVLLAGAVLAGVLAGCGSNNGGNAQQPSGEEGSSTAFKIGGTGPLMRSMLWAVSSLN